MPLPVDNLTEKSPMPTIREAISDSIEQCMSEGKDQDQCIAIAHEIARKNTGKDL